MRLELASSRSRDADVLGFFASYVVPFAAASDGSGRDRLALLLFLAVVAGLYLRADLFWVNPVLGLAGVRVFEAEPRRPPAAAAHPPALPAAVRDRARGAGRHARPPGEPAMTATATATPTAPATLTSAKVDDAVSALRALPAGREGATVEVFAVSRTFVVRRVPLGGDLPVTFLDRALAHTAEVADRPPRAYAPAASLSTGEVMHVPVGAAGRLAELEAVLAAGDVDLYTPSREGVRMLVTRVVLADGSAVTLYRELRAGARLDRSRLAALVWRDGRYDRLEESEVLLVDDRFDALVVGAVALTLSKATFERLFDFVAELRRNAVETFDAATAGLRIDRADELREACLRDPGMLAKLASVRRHLDTDPGYREAMRMDKLVAYVRAHPETGVELSPTGELCFSPDRRKRFKLLKLLDDDYLRSVLTSRLYEANSKSDPL